VLSVSLAAQKSPHGDSFRANCDDCHKTDGWKVDLKTVSFDHDGTKFPLVGQHQAVNCKECHTSLDFAKAQTGCNDCHTDIHEQTVGNECARCHTPNSWVVTNITRLHQQSRFPLIGRHTTADCSECHKNLLLTSTPATPAASLLRFDPMGVECYDCHKDNYLATTKPNHSVSNYSTNCTECHTINSFSWEGAGINHNFFPLSGGHTISECKTCHTSGSFSKIPSECVTCHQPDYAATTNPNHASLNFPATCESCHSLNPGWKPAEYRDHDAGSFPIYSGEHKGEWNSCADCHTNPGNYAQFSCTDCHEHNKGDMDDEHGGVSGYAYNSNSCFGCHPTGSKGKSFDHAANGFPLTNGHSAVDCASCHTNGYAGTSNVCASCHTNNYTQTTSPNHTAAGISNDCASCHTTTSGWKPATYPTHSNLTGVHVPIANECATCHKGSYTNIPKTCFDCHTADYTLSSNPSHSAAQFPNTCADCHSQTAWAPSTFNHDGQYFPIYTGKHAGTWTNCNECHTTPGNYKQNSCINCHDHNQTDMNTQHQGVGGYQYNSAACLSCHPTGIALGFDHNAAGFPLTGGHAAAQCVNCHTSGYAGTSNACASCHTADYNASVNPNHTTLGISTECKTCHTLNPGWEPAIFATHSNYYAIVGAHVAISNDCAACHNGNYTTTPNTCAGCHTTDYNQTTNPSHIVSKFPTTCETCHSQSAWIPATFNHSSVYPLTGAHATVASDCKLCHANGYSNTPNTCAGCHQTDYNQTTNPNHTAAAISNDCASCHTTTPDWKPATYPAHSNLTGAHLPIANNCATCHNGNYISTPNTCAGCHTTDYNQTTNPNHASALFPKTCADCHSQSTWTPANWDHDNQYFPIYSGKHQGEWNTCSDCHKTATNYASFSCIDCHEHNKADMDSEHKGENGYSWNSAACYNCHPKGRS
jgi:hypothetical protein